MSSSVLLVKGSGTVLLYEELDVEGVYTPADRDRNSLELLEGEWIETQPDGFQLIFGPACSPEITWSEYTPPSIECPGENELGCTRNLLPPDYAVPFVGIPVDCPAAASQAAAPIICTIDTEAWWNLCQPTGAWSPSLHQTPIYSIDDQPDPLGRAVDLTQQWVQWFSLPPRELMGAACGIAVPGAAQLNLTSGNLVVSFRTPAAGSFDPPVVFFYNSLSTESSEYGYGWTGLYRQNVQALDESDISSPNWLCKLKSPKGDVWTISRDGDGLVEYINDPFNRRTTFVYDTGNIAAVRDSLDRRTTLVVDGSGDLVRITNPAGTITTIVYDVDHLLVAWINPGDERTTYIYDVDRRLTGIRTPENERTTFSYPDCTTRVIEDARHNLTTVTLDAYGNVRKVETPKSLGTTYTWTDKQRLLSVEDPRNKIATFTYTTIEKNVSRLTEIEKPEGGTYELSYDDGQIELITDENSHTFTLDWEDGLRRRLKYYYRGDLVVVTYSYAGKGQLSRVEHPLSYDREWTFDGVGRRSAAINAEDHRTTYLYSTSHGQVEESGNPLSQTTIYDRNQVNLLTEVTDPVGNITTYTVDANGRRTETKVTRGASVYISTIAYDKDSRVVKEINAEGHVTTSIYDANGNLVNVVSPRGFTMTYAYDADNRLTTLINALPATTVYGYDNSGNRTTVKNPLAAIWTSTYDGDNRLLTAKDPVNRLVTYGYDPVGNQTSVENFAGEISTVVYDLLQRVAATVDAEGHRTTEIYDIAGHKRYIHDPTGAVTTLVYYDDGMLKQRQTKAVSGALVISSFTYYADNRVHKSISPAGDVTTSTYHANGLPHLTIRANLDSGEFKTTLTYYQDNSLKERFDPDGTITTLAYHPDGMLHTSAQSNHLGDSLTTTYDYNADNQEVEVETPTGDITTSVYDSRGLRTEVRRLDTNAALAITTTTYDAADRPIEVRSPSNRRVTSTYYADNLLQATVSRNYSDTANVTLSYGYDNAGRPKTVTTPAGHITTSLYHPDGMLAKVVRTSAAGALVTETYEYDAANRVTLISDPATGSTASAYNAGSGILTTVTRDNSAGSGAVVTTFAYDDYNRQIAVFDSAQGPTTTTTTYFFNDLVESIIRPNQDGDPDAVTEYQYDDLNRVVEVSDPAQGSTFTAYLPNCSLVKEVARVNTANQRVSVVYDYDAFDRLKEVNDPATGRTTSVYYANGLLKQSKRLSTADAEVITSYTYDAEDRPVDVTDPATGITTSTYYTNGLLKETRRTSANGTLAITTNIYDNYDRLQQVLHPDGTTTSTTYYQNDLIQKSINAQGHEWLYAYDQGNRQVKETDPTGVITTTTYYSNGLLAATAVADTSSGIVTTTRTYESSTNRLAAVNEPASGFTTSTYYGNGLLKETVVKNTADQLVTTTYRYDDQNRLKDVQDPASGFTTSTYYSQNGQLESTKRLGANGGEVITSHTYDSANRPLDTYHPATGYTTLSYYSQNGLVKEQKTTAASGATAITTSTYDSANRLKEVRDAEGGIATTTYYDNGAVKETINPSGIRLTTTYDQMGRQVAQINHFGRTTSVYYPDGMLQQSIDAVGNTTSYVYDNANRQTLMTNGAGETFASTYYSQNGLLKETLTPAGDRTTRTYDNKNRLIEQIDGAGQYVETKYYANGLVDETTTYAGITTQLYDSANRPAETINVRGFRTTTTYYNNGLVESVKAPESNITTNLYDSADRPSAVINPRGFRTTTTYYTNGLVKERIESMSPQTSPGLATTTFDYDKLGRQVSVLDAESGLSTTVYRADGLVLATADQLNHRTTLGYDAAGRLESVKNALNKITTSTYYANGLLETTIDPLSRVTTHLYDGADREIKVIDANQNTRETIYLTTQRKQVQIDGELRTTLTFNAAGQEVQRHAGGGNIVTLVYDAAGRNTVKINPLSYHTTYTYEGDVVVEQRDLRVIVTMTYDGNDRLLTEKYPNILGGGVQLSTHTYDEAGNRIKLQDPTGVTTFVYDAGNRAIRQESPALLASPVVTVSYYRTGEQRGLTLVGSEVFTYTLDAARRITSIVSSQGNIDQYFDVINRVTTIVRFSESQTVQTFNDADEITRIEHSTGAGVVASLDYLMDLAGRRTQITDHTGRVQAFSYTASGAIKSEGAFTTPGWASLTPDAWQRLSVDGWEDLAIDSAEYRDVYTYDGSGNRLMRVGLASSTSSLYDAANQLTREIIGGTIKTYFYDGSGNRSSVDNGTAITTYLWNHQNLLLQVQNPDTSLGFVSGGDDVTFSYNGLGQRLLKSVENVATTLFVNFGNMVLAALDELGDAIRIYTHAGTPADPQLVGEYNVASTTTGFPQADAQGNIPFMVDDAGNPSDFIKCSAFGLIQSQSTEVFDGPYGYQGTKGTQLDDPIGLYFLGLISGGTYDPQTATVLNPATSSDPNNQSRFLGNDPVNNSPGGSGLVPVAAPGVSPTGETSTSNTASSAEGGKEKEEEIVEIVVVVAATDHSDEEATRWADSFLHGQKSSTSYTDAESTYGAQAKALAEEWKQKYGLTDRQVQRLLPYLVAYIFLQNQQTFSLWSSSTWFSKWGLFEKIAWPDFLIAAMDTKAAVNALVHEFEKSRKDIESLTQKYGPNYSLVPGLVSGRFANNLRLMKKAMEQLKVLYAQMAETVKAGEITQEYVNQLAHDIQALADVYYECLLDALMLDARGLLSPGERSELSKVDVHGQSPQVYKISPTPAQYSRMWSYYKAVRKNYQTFYKNMDFWISKAETAEAIGEVAGVAAMVEGGRLALKKGLKKVVVYFVSLAGAVVVVKSAEEGARKLGASEGQIKVVEAVTALIAYIIVKRRGGFRKTTEPPAVIRSATSTQSGMSLASILSSGAQRAIAGLRTLGQMGRNALSAAKRGLAYVGQLAASVGKSGYSILKAGWSTAGVYLQNAKTSIRVAVGRLLSVFTRRRAKLPTKPQQPGVPNYERSPESKPLTSSTEPGSYVYVQDADGIVYVVPNAPHAHPSVLGGGKPAAAAGELIIDASGVVIEINNISYTFQHDASVLAAVKLALEQVGLKVAPDAIVPFSGF